MSEPMGVGMARAESELCRLGERSTVAVRPQDNGRVHHVDTFLLASEQLGAAAFPARLPNQDGGFDGDGGSWRVGATPPTSTRPATEVLKGVDPVIDAVVLLLSPEQLEIQESGTRVLFPIDPSEQLRRTFSTEPLRERVEHGEELRGNVSWLRFTSQDGPDVSYQLRAYPVITRYGSPGRPGRWDPWPSEAFAAERGYGLSHVGWQMMHEARWSVLATDRPSTQMEARFYLGDALFSTCPNAELGRADPTACHVDVPMQGFGLHLDGEPVLVQGRITIEDLAVWPVAIRA